jgi:hypothetical protein
MRKRWRVEEGWLLRYRPFGLNYHIWTYKCGSSRPLGGSSPGWADPGQLSSGPRAPNMAQGPGSSAIGAERAFGNTTGPDPMRRGNVTLPNPLAERYTSTGYDRLQLQSTIRSQ